MSSENKFHFKISLKDLFSIIQLIAPELLKFYNYNLDFVCEPGGFEVMIGRSSRDIKKAAFKLL